MRRIVTIKYDIEGNGLADDLSSKDSVYTVTANVCGSGFPYFDVLPRNGISPIKVFDNKEELIIEEQEYEELWPDRKKEVFLLLLAQAHLDEANELFKLAEEERKKRYGKQD